MPDIFGIKYNGVTPSPTYKEFISFVDYPVKFPDRSATRARDSPLLTQLDGTGMMELEKLERRGVIERHKEDMIRHISFDTGTPAQQLRALNRFIIITPSESLVASRSGDVDELVANQSHGLEEEQRRLRDQRLRAMIDETDRENVWA